MSKEVTYANLLLPKFDPPLGRYLNNVKTDDMSKMA